MKEWIVGLVTAANPYRFWIYAGFLVAAVLAVLWWRERLIAEGVQIGRNQVKANELRKCEADYADLKNATAIQSEAINALGRQTVAAMTRASAAEQEARQAKRLADDRARRIASIPASDCASAARQVWGIVR